MSNMLTANARAADPVFDTHAEERAVGQVPDMADADLCIRPSAIRPSADGRLGSACIVLQVSGGQRCLQVVKRAAREGHAVQDRDNGPAAVIRPFCPTVRERTLKRDPCDVPTNNER